MTVQVIGAIVTALGAARLRLDFLHEHDSTLYPRFHNLTEGRRCLWHEAIWRLE